VAAPTAPIKVDVATGGLVSPAAHFMSRSKKDMVDGVARWLCVLLSPDAAVGWPAANFTSIASAKVPEPEAAKQSP